MKLVIKPECQIGARNIRIVFSDRILDWEENRASENIKEEIIRLHKGQSSAATFDSLIHEAEHIVNYLYAVNEEENYTVIHSTGLCQFLLSLGIEPDFSRILEEKL